MWLLIKIAGVKESYVMYWRIKKGADFHDTVSETMLRQSETCFG